MPSSTGTLVFNDQKIQAPDIYATESLGVGVSDPTSNLEVVGNAYVSSNLEVGTANLFVDTTTGNVGVGTTSPAGDFHINGENMYFSSKLVSNCTWRIMPQTGNSSKQFRIYDQDNAANRLVIDASGNVGIGVNNPNVKLDVNGIATFRSQPGFQAWKTEFDLYNLAGTDYKGAVTGFTEQFDVNGDFNPTTGVFTAPEDGLYSFSSNMSWANGDGVDDTIYMLFKVANNSTYGNRDESSTRDFPLNPNFFSRSGKEYSTSCSTLERLESGATVSIYFHNVQDSPGNYIRDMNFFGYKVA
jgi:hypothetical protein